MHGTGVHRNLYFLLNSAVYLKLLSIIKSIKNKQTESSGGGWLFSVLNESKGVCL